MDHNSTTPTRGAKSQGASGQRRRSPKAGGTMQMQVQDHIGRQLRAVYDDLLNQPVPDRFLELLQQLDAQKSTAGEPVQPEQAGTEKSPKGSS